MNQPSPRDRLVGALLGLWAASVFAAQPGAGIAVLDMTPLPNQRQQQTLDMRLTMDIRVEPHPGATEEEKAKVAQTQALMPMTMTLRSLTTLRTGPLGAGGWMPLSLERRTLEGSMTTRTGAAIPFPVPPASKFSARFNPTDFTFELDDPPGGPTATPPALKPFMTQTLNEVLAMAKAMRGKPLKVGESVDLPLNMAIPVASTLPGAAQMNGGLRLTLTRVDHGVAYFEDRKSHV